MFWLLLPHAVGFPLVCGAFVVLRCRASRTLLGLAIRRRPGLILGIKAPFLRCRLSCICLFPLSLPAHRISPGLLDQAGEVQLEFGELGIHPLLASGGLTCLDESTASRAIPGTYCYERT